jgi:hypothetical protein
MPTGAKSIAAALPAVAGSAAGQYYAIGSSGHSTSIAIAPKTLASFTANTFQQMLLSPNLVHALQIQLPDLWIEAGQNLATEGDIERAAALYPCPRRQTHHREGTCALQYWCLGQSTTGTSRPDIKFMVGNTTVLVLEYKRTYVFYLFSCRVLLFTTSPS